MQWPRECELSERCQGHNMIASALALNSANTLLKQRVLSARDSLLLYPFLEQISSFKIWLQLFAKYRLASKAMLINI